MGRKNTHLIRHKAKGGGQKWRPSPGDPALAPAEKSKIKTSWKTSIGDVFKR